MTMKTKKFPDGFPKIFKEIHLEIGIETEWKYILAAFLITIFMTSILVLMLPDSPFEFW